MVDSSSDDDCYVNSAKALKGSKQIYSIHYQLVFHPNSLLPF